MGCSKVSKGCQFCYAMLMAMRVANAAAARLESGSTITVKQEKYMQVVKWREGGNQYAGPGDRAIAQWNNKIVLHEDGLTEPEHWRRPRMVFVNSQTDLFHKDVPREFQVKAWARMIMYQRHRFQVLTKRTDLMSDFLMTCKEPILAELERISTDQRESESARYDASAAVTSIRAGHADWPPPNIAVGTSIEDPDALNARADYLRACVAALRFWSCEPLIASLMGEDLERMLKARTWTDFVILGGESGPWARNTNIGWIRELKELCVNTGTKVFVKQLGGKPVYGDNIRIHLKDEKGEDPDEWPLDLQLRQFPTGWQPAQGDDL